MKRRFIGVVACFILCNQYVAASSGGDVDAEKAYTKYCSVCHGRNGDGRGTVSGLNPPPRNFTAEALPKERIIKSITEGRPGTAMASWGKKLKKDEIESLAGFIRTRFMRVESNQDEGRLEQGYRELGKRVYEDYCSVCHGDRGGSGVWSQSGLQPPPRDFTAAIAQQELLARDRMIFSVTHGRKGTAMMPFEKKLGENEISAVVDYIREEFMGLGPHDDAVRKEERKQHPAGESNTPHHGHGGERELHSLPSATAGQIHSGNLAQLEADMKLPMPNGLKGNIAAGREFFMNNCYECHGKNGDGNGPRAYFINPRPRNFTNELSRLTLNRPALYRAISNGKPRTVMPAWSKVLSDQEIANIAEFVFQTFIQPKK